MTWINKCFYEKKEIISKSFREKIHSQFIYYLNLSLINILLNIKRNPQNILSFSIFQFIFLMTSIKRNNIAIQYNLFIFLYNIFFNI